jgi:hypothetical protein
VEGHGSLSSLALLDDGDDLLRRQSSARHLLTNDLLGYRQWVTSVLVAVRMLRIRHAAGAR